MPYVLRHERTGEVAAGMLRNSYDFSYFGVKWWETSEEAERERTDFLTTWQYEGVPDWHVIEVDEGRLKTMNVKLKNNPAYMVRIDHAGAVEARLREEG